MMLFLLLKAYSFPLIDFDISSINYNYPKGEIFFKKLYLENSGYLEVENFLNNAFVKIDIVANDKDLFFTNGVTTTSVNDDLVSMFKENIFSVRNVIFNNYGRMLLSFEDLSYTDESLDVGLKKLQLKCSNIGDNYSSLVSGCIEDGILNLTDLKKEKLPVKKMLILSDEKSEIKGSDLTEFFIDTVASLAPIRKAKGSEDVLEVKKIDLTIKKSNFTLVLQLSGGVISYNVTVKGTASYDGKFLRLQVAKATTGFLNVTGTLFEKLKVLNSEEDDTIVVSRPLILINLEKFM